MTRVWLINTDKIRFNLSDPRIRVFVISLALLVVEKMLLVPNMNFL
jgi:hypothetical protein